MLRNMIKRTQYVLRGEEGDLNTQMVVLVTLALLVATILFVFKDKIGEFFGSAGDEVDKMGEGMNVDMGDWEK